MKPIWNLEKQIVIGADHRGVSLVQGLRKHFASQNWQIQILGPSTEDKKVDYPLVAKEAAKTVALKNIPGVLICGNGVGMCMAANKVRGARAALALTTQVVSESRQKDNANILCLPGNLSLDTAIQLIELFVQVPFDELTYGSRINLLDDLLN